MDYGPGLFPEPPARPRPAEPVTAPAPSTPRTHRRQRLWPLAVALLILTGSLVADVTVLLVAREVVLQRTDERSGQESARSSRP